MSVCKERAWALLNEISFERVTGTENEEKAAQILLRECLKEEGVKAEIEEFEIKDYKVEKVGFEVLEPEYQSYEVIAVGRSGSTPEEGLEAEFKYVENGNEINLADCRGKIVMVNGNVMGELAERMEKAGVAGYVQIIGNFYDEESIKHELRPAMTRAKLQVPGLKIHMNNAEKVILSKASKVRMTVVQDNEKTATARNVVATIEGTDKKDEIIAFSGHFDSVRYSKGPWDNGTGTVTVMELMHYFAANRPRRTMKFIFCGAEEIGCEGSKAYCEKHKEELENYIFNINFDMTGATVGYEQFTCTASQSVVDAVTYLAKLNNYPVNTKLDIYASDSTSFASNGVPACTFARLAPTGGATIHNHNDIIDRLDPDSFMITLNFVVKFASQLANSDVNLIERKIDDKVKKSLEEMKKRFG